ncbi:MAG: MTH938/NDUFAF3 family protein [Promethearchaeia archaeon]
MKNNKFIQDFGFGFITIQGKNYTNDVILLDKKVISDWWREEGHYLHKSDLEDVLSFEPDLLIIGKGKYGRMSVPKDLTNNLDFEVITAKTEKATKIYNEKLQEDKKIAGAFHLTC